jgi:exopolysaccharide biosynthesis polyprenyl glycosylphosphotransferase
MRMTSASKMPNRNGSSPAGTWSRSKEAVGWHFRRRHWMAHDCILGAIAALLALRFDPSFAFAWSSPNPLVPGVYQACLFFPFAVMLCMHVVGLQDPLGMRRIWIALAQVMLAAGAALVLCLFTRYMVSLQQVGRTLVMQTFAFTVMFLWGGRALLWRLSRAAPKRVGCCVCGESLDRFVVQTGSNTLPLELVRPPDLATDAELADFLLHQEVTEVIVSRSENRRELWMACLNRGIQVTDIAVFVEREYYKVPCGDIDLSWFLAIDLKWNHPFYNRVKRLGDLLAAAAGLALTAPIMVLAMFAILIETGRPIFYSQMRVGFRGRPYKLWKLRTMGVNAENAGAQWAKKADPRVTKVGQWLRRTRIDELPQFWNVLKGEMSIIGPRPERPEFVEQLSHAIPIYAQRHWIKPGITGWAQINYPYGASVADAFEKLCYDLYYMKNASLVLDLHIALRTVGALMKGSR